MEDLIALLFLSRDWGHRQHLRTRSYAQHKALETFYETITDQLDELTELEQGRNEILGDIPQMDLPPAKENSIEVIQKFLALFETYRYKAISKEDTVIQNKCDEIAATFLRTLYKLKAFTEI